MKSLFLVYSPFQLLGVLEAISFFNLKSHELEIVFLLNDPKKKEREYFAWFNELAPFELKFSTIYHTNNISSWKEKVKFIKGKRNIFYNRLFIGDIRETSMKLFAINLNFESLVLLDDGAATINLKSKVSSRYLNIHLNQLTSLDYFKNLTLRLLGFELVKKVDICWFTIFDLPKNNSEIVINHNFSYINSISSKYHNSIEQDSSCIHFVGSNLVNAGVVNSSGDYIELLELTFHHLKAKKIIYYLHRNEKEEKILTLLSKFNIEFVRFVEPLEIAFLKYKIYPRRLCSFYSTALFTLSKLGDYDLLMCNIPDKFLSGLHRENVKTVQKHYSNYFKTFHLL